MTLQPGDIMACYGTDWVSRGITWQTASLFGPRRLRLGPCHVAIMLPIAGELLWCESTSLNQHACLIRQKQVAGCQVHESYYRVHDYKSDGGRVDVYRPTGINRLSGTEERLVGDIFKRYLAWAGVRYDFHGAAISGTRLWKWLPWAPPQTLEAMFCSEVVAALLMRIGRLPRENPTIYNPASLLRTLVNTGVYQFQGAA